MTTGILEIRGMTCAVCSARIEKVLNKKDGVTAAVNLAAEKARVEFDEGRYSIADIIAAVEKLGYSAAVPKEKAPDAGAG
jgi:Cu+-exporting ATPase